MRQCWILAATALVTIGCLQAQNRSISASAQRQISGLLAEKAARTPAQQKMSSHLVHAAKILRREPVHPDYPVPPDAIASVRLDAQNRVTVDMEADVTPELLAAIGNAGGAIISAHPEFHALRARLPLLAVEQVAARREVKQVSPAERFRHAGPSLPRRNLRPDRASRLRSTAEQLSRFFRRQPPPTVGGMFRRLGSAFFVGPDISGDVAHQAGVVRNFGFNGAGVKIGVLSDGVDSLALEQAAGRLPAVTVIAAGEGDEGTALLEILYTLAPGASLYYATAIPTRADMAANIQALADAGCNIIVDDVGYFREGVYQDGIVAQKVNQVTAAGVFYFSSAGNEGNLASGTSGTWEGDFVDSNTTIAAVPKTGTIHSFGSANYNSIHRTSDNAFYFLTWSDPLGNSSNDYDLFILNSTLTSVIASSTNLQNGSQDPFEYVDDEFQLSVRSGNRIVILNVNGGAARRSLYLSTLGGELSAGTNGAIFGHAAATGAIAVAAADAHNAGGGAFTGGPGNPVEEFSSDGPRRQFYSPNGTAITPGNFLASTNGGTVTNKPDLTAADGVTTGVHGFHTFYGTSASAPHAAAIAALVKQANPAITLAQLRPLLAAASLDIGSPGYDFTTGSGIVMAPAAVGGLFGDSVLITIASTPATGLDFSVSGDSCTAGAYTSPATLIWRPGASCTVQWTSPQFLNAFTQYTFVSWLNGPSANLRTITAPATPTTYTGAFVLGPPPAPVDVTVTSKPAGLTILADGVSYATPHTFSWFKGSSHTLDTTGAQTSSGTPYVFTNWSNGGPKAQSVTISAAGTYTANFSTAKTGALAQVAAGGPYSTGILVLNTGGAAAQFSVRFYADQGVPVSLPFTGGSASVLSGTVPARGSAYYEAGDPQIATLAGWGQIVSDPNIVVQALFRNNVDGAYYEAAVPSTPGGKQFVIPFDATTFATTGQPFVTGIAVANLDSTTANITCTARDTAGVTIPNAVAVPSLPALGHWADYQFPALNGQRGTIECVSNTNLSATALRFLGSELSSLPVVTNAVAAGGPSQTGALAQIAAGGSYTTGIFVLNTGAAAAPFSIQFRDDTGASVALPFSTGSASTISGTISAHGSAYYEASDPQSALLTGGGQFSAGSSIVIQALFRNSVSGAFYEAAVPSTPGSKEFIIPFDATTFSATGQPLVTGFAIANLDAASASVTCVARDPSGLVIPDAIAIPALAPLGHWADYQFPALNGQRGTIDCVSTTKVSATALRFLGSAFSSLPVVTK